MKKILFLAAFSISTFTFSQSYKTAIGLKGGYPSLGGINISGLFEIQKPLPELNGLYWYLGVGPTVGFVNETLLLTANGVLGIEYTFQDLPINIALDTGPVIQLIGNRNLFSWGGGIAVRYTLK
jgi:hypothetical protein